MKKTLNALLAGLVVGLGVLLRHAFGILAVVCVFAGLWLLQGLGWALLGVAPLLILADREVR